MAVAPETPDPSTDTGTGTGTDPDLVDPGPLEPVSVDDDHHQTTRELLREAAIAAEYATGRQEETEEAARRHIAIRIGTIVVGFIVLIAGLAMLVLPGQGILAVIIGLTILARELPWAERMLEYAKKKAKIDELKHQPIWVKAIAWGFTALAIAASAWYLFLADPKPVLTEILPWNW